MKEKQAKKTDNYDLTCLCLLDPEKRMRTVNELELSCAKTIQAAFIQMDRIREWDKNIKEWGKKQQNSTKGKTKNE